jgi:murein DD-endopeptidase MepM/ murein hydrolase activator NlpD
MSGQSRVEATMSGPVAADEATMVAPPADEPSGVPDRRGTETAPRGAGAPVFAGVVLALALALAIWAPWREEPPALSDYGARAAAATAPPAAISAITASPRPAPAGAEPAATPGAGAAGGSRPLGLPLKRTDWIILRDYAAHGGPGPNGAVDIGVVGNRDAVGTPVYATHDGVVRVLRGNRLYGNLVAVKNERWSTTYGHLDQVLVSDGQRVRRGDQIGTLGRTGQAAGPQLDYQVWEQVGAEEVNRNPMDFLGPR